MIQMKEDEIVYEGEKIIENRADKKFRQDVLNKIRKFKQENMHLYSVEK
jgi:hypothetical protein